MVTHDTEAAAVGDRLVVLRDGRICHDAASGTSDAGARADAHRRRRRRPPPLMTAVTLRGLFARKARALLTGLAVLLGVAMIAGHLRLHGHDQQLVRQDLRERERGRRRRRQRSLRVRHRRGPVSQEVPDSLVRRVRRGARRADRSRQRRGLRLDLQGERRSGRDAAARRRCCSRARPSGSTRSTTWRASRRRTPTRSRSTRGPPTRRTSRSATGSRSWGAPGRQNFTISGLAKFGDVSSIGGATIAVVTLPEAQRLPGQRGKVDSIQVAAAPGVTPDELRRRASSACCPTRSRSRPVSRTPTTRPSPSRTASASSTRCCSCSPGIAVFVGGVHHLQHVLDHGRAAHEGVRAAADDGRVAGPGPAVGDAGGADRRACRLDPRPARRAWAPPRASTSCSSRSGRTCRSQGLVFKARTAIVGLLVGTIVTLVASLAPARRATRVPPARSDARGGGRARRRPRAGARSCPGHC